MKIEFPLKFTAEYRTSLAIEELIERINNEESEKILKGLVTKKYSKNIHSNQFVIQRYTLGIDLDLILGNPPLIIGTFDSGNPKKIKVEYKPYLLNSIFLFGFSFLFISASFMIQKVTVNGIEKEADLESRLIFFGIGLIILFIGYWTNIRPIRHSKQWLENKLKLTEI